MRCWTRSSLWRRRGRTIVPPVQFHVPQPGDAVPDFKLLNQSGKIIHLAQFKGRVLLVTFIYTRCPLSDYCPRMSRNFAAIDQGLAADPKLYAKTHLLSISFDPGLRYAGGAAQLRRRLHGELHQREVRALGLCRAAAGGAARDNAVL